MRKKKTAASGEINTEAQKPNRRRKTTTQTKEKTSTEHQPEEELPLPLQGTSQQENGSIRVSWTSATNSTAHNAENEYVLVRKEGGIPKSPDDGCVVVDAPVLQYADISVDKGRWYGYCVFVRRHGRILPLVIPCGMCRIATAPRHLSLCGVENSIELYWELSPGVDSYLLVRKSNGVPTNLQDGVAINLSANTGRYVDSGLINGQTYGYLLAHVYKEADGSINMYPGASGCAAPMAAPMLLQPEAWNWSIKDRKMYLSWQLPPNNEILWYILPFPLGAAGSRVYVEGLQKDLGPPALVCDTGHGTTHIDIDFEGYRYLVPIVRNTSQALVCEARKILFVPMVHSLQAQRVSGDIYLSWGWPPTSNEVLIACSREAPPQSADSQGIFHKIRCSKNMYDVDHFHILRHMGEAPLHISVFAMYKWDGEYFFSPPQSILTVGSGGRQMIRYELKRKGGMFGFGKTSLSLSITAQEGTEIPELILIKKKGCPPLSPTDGKLVLTLNNRTSSVEYPLDVDPEDRNCYLRLFIKDPSLSIYYSLIHPESNKLKIR